MLTLLGEALRSFPKPSEDPRDLWQRLTGQEMESLKVTITPVGKELGEPPVGNHLQNSSDYGSELLWQWWIGCWFNIPAGGTRSACVGCESTLPPSSMQMLQYIVIHLHRFFKFQKPTVSIINLASHKYCFLWDCCGIAEQLPAASIHKENKSFSFPGQGGVITAFQLSLCPLSRGKLKVRAPGGGQKAKLTIESSKMKCSIYRREIMRL